MCEQYTSRSSSSPLRSKILLGEVAQGLEARVPQIGHAPEVEELEELLRRQDQVFTPDVQALAGGENTLLVPAVDRQEGPPRCHEGDDEVPQLGAGVPVLVRREQS